MSEIILTEDQRDILNKLKVFIQNGNNDNSVVLSGPAGAGKTTILKELEVMCKNNNFVYLAPTHKACHVLQQAVSRDVMTTLVGLGYTMSYTDSGKLFRTRQSLKNNPLKTLEDNTVLIIDESSMIDSIIFKNFQELKFKKIYVGDINQLGPVEEDGHSEVFDLENIYHLTKVMRSDNKRILKINDFFMKKVYDEKISGKDILQELRSMKEIKSKNYIKEKIKELIEKKGDINIIVYSNKKKDEWNDYCRSILRGIYDTDDTWLPGMRIMINSSFKYYDNYMNIQNKDISFRYVNHKKEEGKQLFSCDDFNIIKVEKHTIKPDDYFGINKDIEVYTLYCSRPEETEVFLFNKIFNEKDNEYFKKKKANKKKEILHEIDLFTGTKFTRKEKVRGIWQEYYDYCNKYDADIEFAMAITSHKSQGSTFKNVFVDITNMAWVPVPEDTKKRSMYVGVSRAKEEIYLF